ncbi:MAG: pilus assembly protein [Zoogloeaceae bacterium]|nr:hypothetical protein [Rhodocyclaceae bacterium]MCP5234960.1 pilus assembly protein [Zoogloeaceae bacterium]
MKILELDFHRPQRSSLFGVALLVAGFAACGLVLADLVEVNQQIDRERVVLARIESLRPSAEQAGRRAADARKKAARVERDRLEGAQAVADRLAIPWGELLAEIEAADGNDVAITVLSPDPNKKVVRIEGQARDLRAMLSYNARLAASPMLVDVALINHEVVLEDPDQPVRFSLSAVWRQNHDRNQ